MIATLDGLLLRVQAALRPARREARRGGACRSCGAKVHPALDECLTCLADRHW